VDDYFSHGSMPEAPISYMNDSDMGSWHCLALFGTVLIF
jgi:hypothetical protein